MIIVIATTNDETAAVIGDPWAYWAKKIGVVGVVCDGNDKWELMSTR